MYWKRKVVYLFIKKGIRQRHVTGKDVCTCLLEKKKKEKKLTIVKF